MWDEVLTRRIVGLVTLILAAFLLSWLLPRPGLHRLQGEGERVVTMDLTRPDSQPEEVLPVDPEQAAATEPATPPLPPAESVTRDEAVQADDPELPETAPATERPAENEVAALPAPPKPIVPPKPAAMEKPGEIVPPKPAVKPEPKPVPPPKPEIIKKPEPKPAPVAAPAEAAPAQLPKPAVNGPKAGTAVAVQAGAYSFLEKAEGVRSRAQSAGVSCVISPAETAKGTLYRLRCGPFADKTKADVAVQKLKSSGIAAQVVSGG